MIPDREDGLVADGLSLLTSAYRGKVNIEAILSVFLARQQALEVVQWDVLNKRLIGVSYVTIDGEYTTVILDAEGVNLEPLGSIVGEARGTLTDAEFLIAIKARIRANRSKGLAENILQLARNAVPVGVAVTYSESPPSDAAWEVQAYGFSTGSALSRLLGIARQAGVRGTLTYSGLPLTSLFRFSSSYGVSAGDTRGPASSYGGTTTSLFSGALET